MCTNFSIFFVCVWSFWVMLQEYSGRDLLAYAFIKSASSKQHSNLLSDTVNGHKWCVSVCLFERMRGVCFWLGVLLFENIYSNMYQECMYVLLFMLQCIILCHLNSISTVHWFLSSCLELHTEWRGCCNYRHLIFHPQCT